MCVELVTVNADDPSEFEGAFARVEREGARGLVASSTQPFSDHAAQPVGLAARNRLPTIYARREPTVAGGLMSLGTDLADAFRQVGVYTGRILKGEKTAFPQTLLVRADEVIE
jgi:putative tryptophan/tyrosine transport system substrate-binding protein